MGKKAEDPILAGPLFPTAVRLAKAISQHESGGRQVHGASGEFGAFQFMPATWRIVCMQVLGKVIAQTPQYEMLVALMKIEKLLERFIAEGCTMQTAVRNVALVWNTSLGGSEKPLIRKGINSKGVAYDSAAYADMVMKIYSKTI